VSVGREHWRSFVRRRLEEGLNPAPALEPQDPEVKSGRRIQFGEGEHLAVGRPRTRDLKVFARGEALRGAAAIGGRQMEVP